MNTNTTLSTKIPTKRAVLTCQFLGHAIQYEEVDHSDTDPRPRGSYPSCSRCNLNHASRVYDRGILLRISSATYRTSRFIKGLFFWNHCGFCHRTTRFLGFPLNLTQSCGACSDCNETFDAAM